ncbi:hypothetical protein LSTR_LSTR002089 [Laodelphax striatellus]|uniref:DH domain-containing protein n=1 Tax=Laodelphax striatellus TaxID=195883 RepID=A0A482XPX3_LAOST|nr:hypothetical protein LSTR_LSTR002089 [Laodelphax striatellus]
MSYSELNSPERTLSDELKELIDNRNILTAKTKHKVINDLQRDKIEKEEKRLNLQMKTMNELVDSERKYLCQLETLLKFFRAPLEDAVKNTAASKVFENIETIKNLNKVLLQRISTDLTPNKIAEAFIELAPFFKLYTNYTNDYKRTIFAIQEVRRQNQRIDDCVSRQESRPEVANRINSLLIVPVQRVPRYRLLLRELAEHTVMESNERKSVEHALRRIEEVTEFINSQVNQQDNVQRLMQIQMSLAGGKPSIILPGRTLVKEGVLMKVADNEDKGKPRHFVLMSDALMCCKLKSGSLHCSALMPLRKCHAEMVLGRGLFSLTGPGCNLLLYSKDDRVVEEWVDAICHAKLEYEQRISTLQKKISSRPSLHSCITPSNDSFVGIEYNSRKRKLENQENCLPNVKRFLRLTDSSKGSSKQTCSDNGNPQRAVMESNRQEAATGGYYSLFKNFLTRIGNWL